MSHTAAVAPLAAAIVLSIGSAAAADVPLRARFDNDFVLESPDRAFQLQIRGNIHLDLRGYQAEERGAPHSFDIRRGRIDLRGKIYQRFTFRVQAELAGSPYLRNAWADAARVIFKI